jgi:phosphoglycerate-specific signal transduction histidine kinase
MDDLTFEEKEILTSVENGEWMSVPNLKEEIKRYQSYAKVQLGELEEIKIELPTNDLRYLQELANQTNTSLQVIIANLLHQFILHNRGTS